jgi:hypothetical protein
MRRTSALPCVRTREWGIVQAKIVILIALLALARKVIVVDRGRAGGPGAVARGGSRR